MIELGNSEYNTDDICKVKIDPSNQGWIRKNNRDNVFVIDVNNYCNKADKLYDQINQTTDIVSSRIEESGGCYSLIKNANRINTKRICSVSDSHSKVNILRNKRKDTKIRIIKENSRNVFYSNRPNKDTDIMHISGFKSKSDIENLVEKTYEEFIYYSRY